MFLRVSLSVLLIGIGIGSPWLVRDWLDGHSDEERANRVYGALSSFPEQLRKRVRGVE